eukprot:gene32174-38918_t
MSSATYEAGLRWEATYDLDNDEQAAPATQNMSVDLPHSASNLNWEAVQRVAADADRRSFRLSESFLAGVNSGRQGGGESVRARREGYRAISNEEKERFRQVLREDAFVSRGWGRFDDDNQAWIAPYHTFAEHRSRVYIRTPSPPQEEPRFSWRSRILRFLLSEFGDRNEVPAATEPPATPATPQSPYILRDDLDRDRDLNWEAVQRVAADADRRSFRLSESFLAGVNSGRQGGGRAGRKGGLL